MEWLHEFYETIAEDSRITVVHISLYVAIRFEWAYNSNGASMDIDRSKLMQLAKISSPVTYQKCMHALHDFGYIHYEPFCGRRKSLVKLRKL